MTRFRRLGRRSDAPEDAIEVEIPPESPWFDGHFDGRPILPAVAQLAVVKSLLCERRGPGSIGAIGSLRLLQPVAPGDVIRVRFAAEADAGPVSFTLHRGATLVTRGGLRWTGEETGSPSAGETSAPAAAPGASLERLLPHRGVARFVERVERAGEGSIRGSGRVPRASGFVESAGVPAFVGLEFAAQCAAALEALERAGDGEAEARVGYLVGVRDAAFPVAGFAPGQTLTAEIALSGSAPPLSIYRVSVLADGASLLTATLSTFITGERVPTDG